MTGSPGDAMKPYQFAILRYQHSAATGEQVNIGVVLWSPAERRLWFRVNERYSRLAAFFGTAFDGRVYRELVRDLERRAERVSEEIERQSEGDLFLRGPTGLAEIVARIAPENAGCFQWSALMGGLSPEPAERCDNRGLPWSASGSSTRH